jgi:hypothetical protein
MTLFEGHVGFGTAAFAAASALLGAFIVSEVYTWGFCVRSACHLSGPYYMFYLCGREYLLAHARFAASGRPGTILELHFPLPMAHEAQLYGRPACPVEVAQ